MRVRDGSSDVGPSDRGLALAGLASARVDVSDGLLADLGHVCAARGVGAEIDLDALPASAALAAFDPDQRHVLQCSGGDAYELTFTATRERARESVGSGKRAAVSVTASGVRTRK